MKKVITNFFVLIGVLSFVGCMFTLGGAMNMVNRDVRVEKDSILFLELEGIIVDGKEFIENLKKYRDMDAIKGVLIQINSPGGVVGPSQEIYEEIKRVREEWQKPVVVSGSGLVASGAYYAAVGADKIVTNPGTMMGSIGVIMSFANLEKLYSWAKIQRYSLTTGPYKDAGADYKSMTDAERSLFQEMLSQVHMQFKKAVAEGRKLPMDKVELFSDGRVFTGETAVKNKFADQLGTLEDAKRLVGNLSGLGENPELFVPPKKRPDFYEMFTQAVSSDPPSAIFKSVIQPKLTGLPLFLVPGVEK